VVLCHAATVTTRRAALMATIGMLVGVTVAGCSGDGGEARRPASTSTSLPTATLPPSSTTTTPSGMVEIRAAPWHLDAPVSREVLLVDDSSLYVIGGLDAAKTSSSAVLRVDPTTGDSVSVGELSPAVHDAAGFVHAGELVVVAGGSPPAQSTVQSVVPNGSTHLVGSLVSPRADHVVAVVGDTAYALGGGDEQSGQTRLLDSVVASADGGANWRDAGALAEAVRYPAVAVVDGAIYLFGGVTTADGTDTRSVQRFDPATGTTTVVAQLPAALSHASAVLLGGRVYVAGGFVDNQISAQVVRFDPTTNEFEVAGALPAPVTDGATAVLDGVGYFVGGQGADRAVTTGVTTITPIR